MSLARLFDRISLFCYDRFDVEGCPNDRPVVMSSEHGFVTLLACRTVIQSARACLLQATSRSLIATQRTSTRAPSVKFSRLAFLCTLTRSPAASVVEITIQSVAPHNVYTSFKLYSGSTSSSSSLSGPTGRSKMISTANTRVLIRPEHSAC